MERLSDLFRRISASLKVVAHNDAMVAASIRLAAPGNHEMRTAALS